MFPPSSVGRAGSAKGGPAFGWGCLVKSMFNIYVLRSRKNNKRYVGCTSKASEIRMREHNSGTDDWTRHNGPFDLLYTEQHKTKAEALRREKFLKSGQGRKLLDIMFPPSSVGRAGSAKGGPAFGWGCLVKSMFNIYVLRSRKNNKRYVGCTSKASEIRMREHNSGTDDWTRHNGPFDLLYTEQHKTKAEALRREKFLKSGQGRKLLDIMFPPSSVGRAGGC